MAVPEVEAAKHCNIGLKSPLVLCCILVTSIFYLYSYSYFINAVSIGPLCRGT